MTLSPLMVEAADDFDRLCAALGTSSLSRKEFVDVICRCDLLESTKDDKNIDDDSGKELFDQLLAMCREAEVISTKMAMPVSFSLPSKALQAAEIDGDALRCLYSCHPTYTTCWNPMDTALALTDYIKDLFERSISNDNAATPLETATQATCSETSLIASGTAKKAPASDQHFGSKRALLDRSSSMRFLRGLSDLDDEEKKMDNSGHSCFTVTSLQSSDDELEAAVDELM
eukprot:2170914-Ditylum_brightwellii.AAC.1